VPSLLPRFYNGLMLENFPDPDELDPLEIWLRMLDPKDSLFRRTILHIILMFRVEDSKMEKILAANVFEFYPVSKCGLCSYLVVDAAERGRGLARMTTAPMLAALDMDARRLAGLERCPAVFAETNDPTRVRAENDSVPPLARLKMLVDVFFKQDTICSGSDTFNRRWGLGRTRARRCSSSS